MAARATPDETLSGSWLASRLGIEPHRLDARRRAGELLASRSPGKMEWRYPAWQFKRGFQVIPGIDRVVAAARAAGLDDRRLTELLSQRAGLVQAGTLADSLRDGRVDHVVATIRASA